MNPEIEFLVKLIPALVAVIGVPTLLYNLQMARKGHLREEYKHAQAFFENLRNNRDMDPFERELGLVSLAGNRYIDPELILFVLTIPSPVRALRDLVRGRDYVELCPEAEGKRLQFKAEFRNVWRRRARKAFHSVAYFILAFLSLSPLFLGALLHMSVAQVVQAMFLTVGCCVPYAWLSLREVTAIYRAEALLRSQDDRKPDGPALPKLSLATAS